MKERLCVYVSMSPFGGRESCVLDSWVGGSVVYEGQIPVLRPYEHLPVLGSLRAGSTGPRAGSTSWHHTGSEAV